MAEAQTNPVEGREIDRSQMTVSDEIAIEITNMNKWYGTFHVLRDINLTVNRGERIVICGPSGSGKSTLIRCINALEEHQTRPKSNRRRQTVRRKWTFKRTSTASPPRSGWCSSNFNPSLHSHHPRELHAVVAELGPDNVLQVAGRGETCDVISPKLVKSPEQALKYPGQLSGGQQAVASPSPGSAVHAEPRIIDSYDEPTPAPTPR